MLTTINPHNELISVPKCKPERVLPGHLLPANNNRGLLELEDVYTVTVIGSGGGGKHEDKTEESDADHQQQQIIGVGLFHKCTANQIYCSMLSVAKQFEQGFVNVEPFEGIGEKDSKKSTKKHLLLKVTDVRPALPDLSGLPQYYSAFAEPEARPLLQCLLDEFVKAHVGIKDVETRRNFTVDLYDSESGIDEHPAHLWRDFAGFIVTDRFRYCELELDSQNLLLALQDSVAEQLPPVALQPLSATNRALFHEYDQSVSMMGRAEYLDFLLDIVGIIGVIAIDEQQRQPMGYAIAYGGRILQCYAEDEKVAGSLLCALCRQLPSGVGSSSSSVSLFLRLTSAQLPLLLLPNRLLPIASRIRCVRRFHSRSMPSAVKWAKVFAPAIGLHLF